VDCCCSQLCRGQYGDASPMVPDPPRSLDIPSARREIVEVVVYYKSKARLVHMWSTVLLSFYNTKQKDQQMVKQTHFSLLICFVVLSIYVTFLTPFCVFFSRTRTKFSGHPDLRPYLTGRGVFPKHPYLQVRSRSLSQVCRSWVNPKLFKRGHNQFLVWF
jgi:hypothetical protein